MSFIQRDHIFIWNTSEFGRVRVGCLRTAPHPSLLSLPRNLLRSFSRSPKHSCSALPFLHLGWQTGIKPALGSAVQLVQNLPAMQETQVWFLGWEQPLEKEMATHSSILAWRIPWTEEPGRQGVAERWARLAHFLGGWAEHRHTESGCLLLGNLRARQVTWRAGP